MTAAGTFSFTYDPTRQGTCPCGAYLGAYISQVDGKTACGDCVEQAGWPQMRRLLDGLDQIDASLLFAPQTEHLDLLTDVFARVFEIAAARVPLGIGCAVMPDAAFVDELLTRAWGRIPAEQFASVIRACAPEMTAEQLSEAIARVRDAAFANAAAFEGQAIGMAAGAALLAGEPDGTCLGEAVDRHGIDFERFSGAMAAEAAKTGVPIADLPQTVVAGCIAATKTTGGTQ